MKRSNWPNTAIIERDSLVVKLGGLSAATCSVWRYQEVPGRSKRCQCWPSACVANSSYTFGSRAND